METLDQQTPFCCSSRGPHSGLPKHMTGRRLAPTEKEQAVGHRCLAALFRCHLEIKGGPAKCSHWQVCKLPMVTVVSCFSRNSLMVNVAYDFFLAFIVYEPSFFVAS
mmetsp:Transcript_22583/g.38565  ORF Transcript_22583/g.38565 Transcript_22583/m.38565 type:complete len:107 (+) Transcript_22583:134-454(+)